ncbi:hypothetical protein [Pseudoduganella namucuonensis]|uniref:Uncharacterized protein n=1 Tax=Pseudoduganella namucuonensis TaxID=1035707 RepID=A0A1I7I8Z4_9BURK|nr:hypothetical protein [Pseudoduganella namucuonensis]SFU69432.1 hypothetical protein SAMN05216552_1007198 [Pseudoduganella namucuonensis]
MHSVPNPTKEQVRAYMRQRGRTQMPPPSPAEIRRQLGWCHEKDAPFLVFPSPQLVLILPGTMAQLSALMAVEWMFVASGFRFGH